MDKMIINEIEAPIFEGITPDELRKMLKCVGAYITNKEKGDVILREHSEVFDVGVLLTGEAVATQLDASGRQLVMAHHSTGSIFGDVLVLSPERKSPVTLTALTDVKVLSLPFEGILNRCSKGCVCHDRLVHNMLRVVSDKYFELLNRLICMARPSLREKILFYLEGVAAKADTRSFSIPFDRAALAEYLNAERSALSRELSSMKRDGLIDYHKNMFLLT